MNGEVFPLFFVDTSPPGGDMKHNGSCFLQLFVNYRDSDFASARTALRTAAGAMSSRPMGEGEICHGRFSATDLSSCLAERALKV